MSLFQCLVGSYPSHGDQSVLVSVKTCLRFYSVAILEDVPMGCGKNVQPAVFGQGSIDVC